MPNTVIFKQNHQVRLLVFFHFLLFFKVVGLILFFWVYLFYLHMGDFLYGRCSKGAGRTHNVIDLKFYLLLDLSFKASSPPPPPHPLRHPFNLFIDTGVILSYEMVSKCFNTFRRLDYNKIKKLRGDSFSQLVRLREL